MIQMVSCSQEEKENGMKEQTFEKLVAPQAGTWKYEIVYYKVAIAIYMHATALYGLYLSFTEARWQTLVFSYIMYVLAGIGVTAGAHRLWSHKAYKAKLPLQILLIIMNSLAFQKTAINWVWFHRMHHRYSDTDADPHNPARGFFFAHIGWLLVKTHPEALRRWNTVDVSDILANPVLTFQYKYAIPVFGIICFLLPTLIPVYCWGETLQVAWNIAVLRYVLNLHAIFSINSFTHIWGNKPYDKHIRSTQNLSVSAMSLGEGFHNYHHSFPWDYRAAELGNNCLNMSTKFIDFFAWIGWAYDLKTVPEDTIKLRAKRRGDGTNAWGGFKENPITVVFVRRRSKYDDQGKQNGMREQTFENLVAPQAGPWKYEIVYFKVAIAIIVHAIALYGLYLSITEAKWQTLMFKLLPDRNAATH